jgi:hypothetical protein
MRRSSVLVLVAAVVVSAGWVTSSSAISSPKVFSLLDVTAQELPLGDFGFENQRPPAAGDQFAFVDDLYQWDGAKRGERAGRVRGTGTFIKGFGPDFSQRALVFFSAQAYLKGGTVLVQGYGTVNPDGPSKFTFPVTGGTGIYANARGFVKVRDLGDGNQGKSNIDLHLLP